MDNWLLVAGICFALVLAASFVERVCGFGMGIVMMTVLPFLCKTFGEATALSGLISLVSTTFLAFRYRKHIRLKLLLAPLAAYIPINYLAIWLVSGSDVTVLKIALGIFLILLSLYFIFFSAKISIKANVGTGLCAGSLSGLSGGAFSVGGPPIVVYLLSATGDDKLVYLATIQCFFALTGYVSNFGRLLSGFVTVDVLTLLPIGLFAMVLGIFLGSLVYRKLNAAAMKKCVYAFMAVAGILLIVTSLMS